MASDIFLDLSSCFLEIFWEIAETQAYGTNVYVFICVFLCAYVHIHVGVVPGSNGGDRALVTC